MYILIVLQDYFPQVKYKKKEDKRIDYVVAELGIPPPFCLWSLVISISIMWHCYHWHFGFSCFKKNTKEF